MSTFLKIGEQDLPEEEPALCKEGNPRVANAVWLKWYMRKNTVGITEAHKEFRTRLCKQPGGLCL